MSDANLSLPSGRFSDALLALWRWWSGEIHALLPRQPATITVYWSDDEVRIERNARGSVTEVVTAGRKELGQEDMRASLAERLRGAALGTPRTVLVLPSNKTFRRIVRVPIASGKNLPKILGFELERHSPIDPSRIYFDYRLAMPQPGSEKLSVSLRIVKRSTVDDAVSMCRALGLDPTGLEFEGDRVGSDGGTLRLNAVHQHTMRRQRWALFGLSLLAFALGVALLVAQYDRQVLLLDMLESEIGSARKEAQEVNALKASIAEAQTSLAFLARQRQKPLFSAILKDVTHALPDGSWAYALQMNRPEIRLRGYSGAAPSLVELLDTSGPFTGAEFRSALTEGQKPGQERFDLSFSIKEQSP